MTGALGLLGAPRQRSAGNLSVARQARPSGSVMKITLLSLFQLAGPCVLSPYPAYGSVGLRIWQTREVRLGPCLCAMGLPRRLVLPLVRCLTNLRIVAALPITRRRPKSIWPGFGSCLVVAFECKCKTQIADAGCGFGSRVPTHRSHQPVGRCAGRSNSSTLCNAPGLGCHPGIDSPDLALVQLLVLTSHKVQYSTEHKVPNPATPPESPAPRPGPRSSHIDATPTILIPCLVRPTSHW